jgi:hypothetical protein
MQAPLRLASLPCIIHEKHTATCSIFVENQGMTLPRPRHLARLHALPAEAPTIAIIGARQIGKTTPVR